MTNNTTSDTPEQLAQLAQLRSMIAAYRPMIDAQTAQLPARIKSKLTALLDEIDNEAPHDSHAPYS